MSPHPSSSRTLADYSALPTELLGDPQGLHFRFYQGGHLQALRHGQNLLVNLTLGCPLAGAMHRLDVELTGPGGIRVLTVIGPGSHAAFSITPTHARWQLAAHGLDISATLAIGPNKTSWCLRLAVSNNTTSPVSWRALHGLDVGLTSQGAARNNEAYTSQYVDHRPLGHACFGTVLASRQNLPVDGRNPFLLQACLDGCEAFATDARDVLGPAIRRPGPPLCLGAHATPLPGLRQAESSYVALLSRRFECPPGTTGECHFAGRFLADHPAPSSDADLALLETAPPAMPAPGTTAAATSVRTLFHAPAVIHGADLTDDELRALVPGTWDLVERSPNGVLWSFFTGADSRHIVTRAKESISARPHGNILRSGGGDFPDASHLSTTTFMAGIFNALLSGGHCSFHRLLSFPRESCGLFAATGQRIWIRDRETWMLLGVPSFFEMALTQSRWHYRLPNHTLEVTVGVDPIRSSARLELRVTGGPAAAFLVTHGLIAGCNEYDAPAELEIDAPAAIVRIRAAADGLMRQADPAAHFTLRPADPNTIEAITGAEPLAGGDPSHAMLVVQTREVAAFAIEIEGHTTLAAAADTSVPWQQDSLALRLRGGNATIGRIQHILPWFVHNGMIHLTVPHGIEQYNGGAWGTRDVTQGSVELLLSLGRFTSCGKILLLTYQHQFLGGCHWPQWFMTDPFGWIQQAHCHGDIPLWPLKALCDYLEATSDFAILDEAVAWTQPGTAAITSETSSLLDHVIANVGWLRANCIPGTALLRYVQRAELSSCFSREIGIFYTHAHLRYLEAMARLGHADRLLDGFDHVTPAALTSSVPHALPRQANAYCSSSDAAVPSRYEAAARYAGIKAGKVPVDGGWRIYSSGPGIYVNLVLTRMLGLRRHYEHVVLDPVLPFELDGLEAKMPWENHLLHLRFSIKHATHTPPAPPPSTAPRSIPSTSLPTPTVPAAGCWTPAPSTPSCPPPPPTCLRWRRWRDQKGQSRFSSNWLTVISSPQTTATRPWLRPANQTCGFCNSNIDLQKLDGVPGTRYGTAMARPLRYEASGAVYHVMARGDGGKDVFENNTDRLTWLTLLERTCTRFGWRVHAWVQMKNHFHLLLETPEPNLVMGMKWLLGVFSQGWNRRRNRRGHVFQGRYKAVVVNGEERDGSYFKIVADYIHLNPVRAGWVGGVTNQRLRSWPWSSFLAYGGEHVPDWLELSRVLRAFQLGDDRRGARAYAGYLEARAKDLKSAVTDDSLAELRRGWYLGESSFGERILATLADNVRPKRRRGSIRGAAARAHDESEAEKIARAGLSALGVDDDPVQLSGRGRRPAEKAVIAAVIRKRTGVRNQWVANRLGMGNEGNVTRAVRWTRNDPAGVKSLKKLEAMLEKRD